MSRLNRKPRRWNTRFRRTVIVHPSIKKGEDMTGTASDYIDVPTINTRGEWPVSYMLSDDQLVHLAILANHLPEKMAQHSTLAAKVTRRKVTA